MPQQTPNIIYILADDMGYGDMGCNNSGCKIPTPHLDRLAAQGMRFTDAHASSSVCSPSRYALLTGRYCWRTPLKSSVLWPWDPPLIEAERPTVAKLLRQQGYRTACIGKWHLGWEWATKDGKPAYGDESIGRLNREQRQALERNIDYSQPIGGGPLACGFDYYFGVDVPNFPPYTWFEQDRLAAAPTEQKPEGMFGLPGAMKPGWKLEDMVPEFVRRTRAYIAEAGSDPFFLYLPLTSPHTPIVPNEDFIGRSGAGLYGDFVCEVDWVVGEIMATLDEQGLGRRHAAHLHQRQRPRVQSGRGWRLLRARASIWPLQHGPFARRQARHLGRWPPRALCRSLAWGYAGWISLRPARSVGRFYGHLHSVDRGPVASGSGRRQH